MAVVFHKYLKLAVLVFRLCGGREGSGHYLSCCLELQYKLFLLTTTILT